MNPQSSRGFTLIEILVVLTILGLLFGIGALAIRNIQGAGHVAKTESILSMAKGFLEQYRNATGDYPPSSLAKLGVRSNNTLFEGNEAMVLALNAKEYTGNRIEEQYLRNRDEDRADKNISIFDDPALLEVVDAWDNPLVYIRYDQYEAAHDYEFTVQATGSTEPVQVKAAKSTLTGSYFSKESYQLVSAGEDGVFGNEDDIRSYGDSN
jgi:prepilin-type N-terminal cleavage/methylation domain-containing protein